ncbi:ribitol-5-phosphate transferase FKTN-like [Haliotis rufescens]|uniref:ribitol-5-phosphate transferase FKTN-like n=1 Tax=Haliotis rufescens TaxID=6454 RepID=UPI00201F68A2|nr:ribitol-5-phosphate transferase FKTN-like [Haliotis rufescens]
MWLHLPHTVEHFLVQISKAEFIECDYQGAQKYLRHNHQATSTMTQYGTQVLLQVTKVLDDLGIQFWLSCGTCLGWYRQCGFIAHTTDIDIEIPIQEYSTSIIPAFLKAGFKLVLVTGKPSDSYTFAVVAHIKVDVFFVYAAKTYQWYGATEPKSGRKFKYILPKFEVCWTHFMGIRVRVPCPALPYIIASYGHNWNTPVKHWNSTSSGKNVKKNGVWPKEERDSVIQVYLLL